MQENELNCHKLTVYYHIKYSVIWNFLPLIKTIISHVRFIFMVISHVTIIADSASCFNAIFEAIFWVMGNMEI